MKAMAGIWDEIGGLAGLVRLDCPAHTPGMVVVAVADEPWQTRPELRWQVWPEDLVLAKDQRQLSGGGVMTTACGVCGGTGAWYDGIMWIDCKECRHWRQQKAHRKAELNQRQR